MSKLDELQALADAATPGPWRQGTHERENVFCEHEATMGPERVLLRMNTHFPGFKRDAAFIAAANPQTVLALVEALRHAQSMRRYLTKALSDNDVAMDASERFDVALAKLEGRKP